MFRFSKIMILSIGLANMTMAYSAPQSLCTGYFGDNVCIFNANQPANIQSTINAIHNVEQGNIFGGNGYALLFQPGNYSNISVPVGYYTQVIGLGMTPIATTIGNVTVNTTDPHGHNTATFWRSAENFSVMGDMTWAVSQASPLRNLDIPGTLNLSIGQWVSGGFLANTKAGKINYSNQQQWLTRNTISNNWAFGGVWSTVFVGDANPPAPASPNTVVDDTPTMQEKPYLTYDAASQHYQIIVPGFNKNPQGTNWQVDSTTIDQNDFIIVNSGMSSDQINTLLAAITDDHPKAVIFTPGQYNKLTSTITIARNNTVVLGLGVPVLTAQTPHIPIMVTSGTGIKISGLIFEAGSNETLQPTDPSLLQIGKTTGSGSMNSPTVLSDIYCRVGGRIPAQTNSCITINDNYTIGDNLWLWRADNGAGAGSWTSDQSNHGLIVNGQFVTIYGLAVEHFQENQVTWYGDNGSVYFYQSELPYIVPTDYVVPASFKLEDSVTHFKGYGFGVYSVFQSGGSPSSLSGIETPNKSGISFTHMVTIKLSGGKGIDSVLQTSDGKSFGTLSLPPPGGTRLESWSGANP